MHLRTYKCIRVCMYVCTYACMYVRRYVYKSLRERFSIPNEYMYKYAHLDLSVSVCVLYIYIYLSISVYIYIFIYICVHMHVQERERERERKRERERGTEREPQPTYDFLCLFTYLLKESRTLFASCLARRGGLLQAQRREMNGEGHGRPGSCLSGFRFRAYIVELRAFKLSQLGFGRRG